MAFAAEWLALREPADLAARDTGLMARAVAALPRASLAMDLGCGTGATVRAFDNLLPGGPRVARWRLVDRDAGLLALARAAHPVAETVEADLRELTALPWEGVGLVTCSALLDLMPAWWISALVAEITRRRLPFYAALSYDGAMSWQPPLPEDAAITGWFNRHQRGDKGLGPALGPDAATACADAFANAGYRVWTEDSPWRLGPEDAALQSELLRGIGSAAGEAGHPSAPDWAVARQAAIAAGQCVIGHTDLFAVGSVM